MKKSCPKTALIFRFVLSGHSRNIRRCILDIVDLEAADAVLTDAEELPPHLNEEQQDLGVPSVVVANAGAELGLANVADAVVVRIGMLGLLRDFSFLCCAADFALIECFAALGAVGCLFKLPAMRFLVGRNRSTARCTANRALFILCSGLGAACCCAFHPLPFMTARYDLFVLDRLAADLALNDQSAVCQAVTVFAEGGVFIFFVCC